MTTTIIPSGDVLPSGPIGAGGLDALLKKDGQFPPMSLLRVPLDPSDSGLPSGIANALASLGLLSKPIVKFLSYSFSSSIIVPVETFTFNLAIPDKVGSIADDFREGDIVVLSVNDVGVCTGIIDQVEIETDAEFGEKAVITGRNLMGQLEDHDAISLDSSPIWAESVSLLTGVKQIIKDTRITNVELTGLIPPGFHLLATEPGESKLAALQRFLEPLNCVAWMDSNGTMLVGKPDMVQPATAHLIIDKENRFSNALSMRVVRASTQIPNVIVPVWSGQEITVNRASPQQALLNMAQGPARLFKLGHRLPKTVIVSTPQGSDPQGLSGVNAINAAGGSILKSYAKRELARLNTKEIDVQVVMPGHLNFNGDPYVIDTVYKITYDRGKVDENMYLYQVEYQLSEDGGQKTNLFFCRLGSIVADNLAPGS